MSRNRVTATLLGAAALTCAVVVGGCGSAGTGASPATHAPASHTSASPTPVGQALAENTPAAGTVHIITYSINSDGPNFRTILTGAVGDYGPSVTVYPDGQVDPGHTSELELKLTHGSFRLGIAGIDRQVVTAYQHWPSDPGTCSGTIGFTATAPIVTGSGTGLYRGISGSFRLTVTIGEVDVKPVCNGTSAFLSQVVLMTGAGNVSF